MTRTSKDEPAPVPGEPEPPGGRAAERRREFEQARGIGDEATPPADEGRDDEDHHESTSPERERDESTPADDEGDVPPSVDDEVISPDDGRDPAPPRDARQGERNSD